MFPYKEDLCRFDFEVAPEDEYMVNALTGGFQEKPSTPEDTDESEASTESEQQDTL